jgi:hypothetical protein
VPEVVVVVCDVDEAVSGFAGTGVLPGLIEGVGAGGEREEGEVPVSKRSRGES